MRYLVSAAMVMAAVGCGGDDGPVEKCDALVETLCSRAVSCAPGSGTESQCVQSVQSELPCGSAEGVTASYGRCMSQLRSFSCDVLFPVDPSTGQRQVVLPADCEGVILLGREAPPAEPLSTPFEGAAGLVATD